MARSKSSLVIQAEYWPLRGLLVLLAYVPLSVGTALCAGLLRLLLFTVLRSRREVMRENLAQAFPEKSVEERDAVANESLRILCQGIALFSKFPRWGVEGLSRVVVFDGLEHLDNARRPGKGILHFTAHLGCWELIAACVPPLYSRSGFVVRPLDNPKLNDLVTSIRSIGGGEVIPHRQLLKRSLKILKETGTVGILIDQNFAPGGTYVDFFGKLASSTPVVSALARRTGCPVVPIWDEWKDGKVHIHFEPELLLSTQPLAADALAEDTQHMTTVIEQWIRRAPAQWLWLHKRWKRQPQPGELISISVKGAALTPSATPRSPTAATS